MNIFNTAKAAQGAKEGEEQQLLCLWQGKDVVHKAECMCVQFSPDSQVVAAGGADGHVRIFNGADGAFKGRLSEPSIDNKLTSIVSDVSMPIMAMVWNPKHSSRLRIATAAGKVELYDVKRSSLSNSNTLQKIQEVDNENNKKPNETLALDYASDGTKWVSGGKDRVVRVYDDASKDPIAELRGSLAGTRGHSNRISAVKFFPGNPNIIGSCGLDGVAMLWDLTAGGRVTEPKPNITYEPHVTMSEPELDVRGAAMDFDCETMMTGSWRPARQLQLWDMRSGKLERDIPWKRAPPPPKAGALKSRWGQVRDVIRGSTNVYAASFINRGPLLGGIVAGGTAAKEVKVFGNGRDFNYEPLGSMTIPSGVMNLHVAPNGEKIAVAAYNGIVYGVKMPEKPKSKQAYPVSQ